jgi:hypothetical protein
VDSPWETAPPLGQAQTPPVIKQKGFAAITPLRSLLRFAFTGCVCVFCCSCAIGPKLSRPKKTSEN